MIRLALASLRVRAAASVATFLAVLGCSLVIACGGLFETGLRLNSLPQRLAGAPVVITGSSGFPLPNQESETVAYRERSGVGADLVGEVAAVAGVDRAVPDVSFPAVLLADPRPSDTGAFLSGHDWTSAALTPYTLRAGREPQAGGEVVLDATSADRVGARPGDRVDIAVAGQRQVFVVTGVAEAGHRVAAPALFFTTADAQRLSAHPGTVDAIGVIPAAGTDPDELADRLRARFPDLTVLAGDDRGAAEFAGIAASFLPLILLSAIVGGMVVTVMGIVVAVTIGLTVRNRERELALLRASGATPGQVRRMVVAETMVVAVLAVAASVGLGRILGEWIFDLITDRAVVPAALEFRQGPLPFAAGVVLGLVGAWLAATLAARRAARTRPIQALAEAAIPPAEIGPVRRIAARIFAAAMVGLAVVTMFLPAGDALAIAGPAALMGAIAVALLGPQIVTVVVGKASTAIGRVLGTHGSLAVINTRTRAVQFAAVLMPITLGTAVAFGNVYAQTTENAARVAAYADQLRADVLVTSTIGGTTADLLADVRATPGVAAASPLVSSTGWIENPYDSSHGSDPWPLFGVDAQQRDAVIAIPVSAGSLADLSGNTVALPVKAAERIDVGIGDQITMRLGDGTRADVRVVALLDSPRNYANLVLPAGLLAAHTTAELPASILVRAAAGQDPRALADVLRERVRDRPGIEVGGPDALVSGYDAGLGMQAWIGYLVSMLAIAYAAIATVNTIAVLVLARRREFGLQRLTGATRRQVTRMALIEGVVIATMGLALGTGVSLFTVIPMAVVTSRSVVPSGPPWVLAATVVATVLLVILTTAITARMAMKRTAIEAVGLPDA
jgi:putative ABC transport system permease protein